MGDDLGFTILNVSYGLNEDDLFVNSHKNLLVLRQIQVTQIIKIKDTYLLK